MARKTWSTRSLLILISLVILVIFAYGITGPTLSIYQTTKQTLAKLGHEQTHEQTSHSDSRYDVLILTYMRSGSTFVGKILGMRDDTFYWYEPLWNEHKWWYLTQNGRICNYRNSTCKNDSTTNSVIVGESLEFLSDVYSCNNLTRYFKHLTIGMQGMSRYAGPTGASFRNCSNRTKKCQDTCKKNCFDTMIDRCGKAKHKVTKVLRMDALLAGILLEKHKNLKLVQIFRDPRAIISSRIKTKWYYENIYSPEKDAKVLCKRIEKDIKAAEDLAVRFPNRVMILQYEDFYNPKRLALNLYKFAGMEIQPDFNKNFNKSTDTGAGFHPDAYRSYLEWNLVKVIDRSCYRVIQKFGLRLFESEEELKNLTLNLVVNSLPYAFH